MQTSPNTAMRPATPEEYIASLPDDRKAAMSAIRKAINKKIPKGFEERICYGSLGWVVPHSLFPAGYHCDPSKPLMLIGLASTKGHISMHHLGLYSSGPLLKWFQDVWPKHSTRKLDMGKGCVRFKRPDEVPLELIGELASKLTPLAWIEIYEKALMRNS
ncbi:MAG: DUF1801 domain-containing protein [Acidobacteriota bacterium]